MGSIAAGNTATSLSAMVDSRVNIRPTITLKGIEEVLEEVPRALGGEGNIVNAVYFSVSGQISGKLFLILPISESPDLVKLLTGDSAPQTEELDEMGMSALKELGNILAGTYLSALAKVSKIKATVSVVGFASDSLKTILGDVLAGSALKTGKVVVVENVFTIENSSGKLYLIFMPEPASLQVMLEALEVVQE